MTITIAARPGIIQPAAARARRRAGTAAREVSSASAREDELNARRGWSSTDEAR